MFKASFLNVQFAQNELVVPTFDLFLSKAGNVDRIIEVGTGCGIFTVFLGIYCFYNDKKLITYDIEDKMQEKTRKLFRTLGIDYRIKNIFENITEIKDEIQKQGCSVVLCDNGNKVKEFQIFSKFLKSGDFIFAHDYAKDLDFFRSEIQNKYWNWLEIDDKRIEDSCNQESLVSYMQEEFQKCSWVCKQKK